MISNKYQFYSHWFQPTIIPLMQLFWTTPSLEKYNSKWLNMGYFVICHVGVLVFCNLEIKKINFQCQANKTIEGLWYYATFKNISVISWRPVLLMEETVVPRENDQPATSYWQTKTIEYTEKQLSWTRIGHFFE